MSLKRRIDAIEAAQTRRQQQMIAGIAAEYGLTLDELLDEAHEFFSLSLDEQLAEVDRTEADLRAEGMSMDDKADIKETLTRYYQP